MKYKSRKAQQVCFYICYNLLALIFIALRRLMIEYLKLDPATFYGVLLIEFAFRTAYSIIGVINYMECILFNFIASVYLWTIIYSVFSLNLPTILPFLIILTGLYLLTVIFGYFSDRERKLNYYLSYQIKKQNEWSLNFIENINCGFIYLKNKKIEYANKSIINRLLKTNILNEYLPSFTQNADSDSNTISINLDILEKNSNVIMNSIFEDLRFENSKEQSNMNNIENNNQISYSDKFYNNFIAENMNTEIKNNFIFLGTKILETNCLDKDNNNKYETKEDDNFAFELYCRYSNRNGDDEFEFIFNDVTRTKLIEEKNAEFKYKSIFLSKVAHEFKNPLVCISELVEQTNDQINDQNNIKCYEHLPMIKSLSDYLLILIKDLDYFSEKQSSKISNKLIEKLEIDHLVKFCSDITTTLLFKINKRHIVKFIVDVDESLPKFILTDEFKLKQILINLLSNSVKFTNKGTIIMKIALEEESTENKRLIFSVIDSGIGINSNFKQNLFKPFIKGHSQQNKLGTGLGLTIVKDLTQLIGSEIQFTTEVDKGSIFWFTVNLMFHNTLTIRKSVINEDILYNNVLDHIEDKSQNQENHSNCNKNSINYFCDSSKTLILKNFICMPPTKKSQFINTTAPIPIVKYRSNLNILNISKDFQQVYMDIKDNNLNNQKQYIIIVVDDEYLTRQSAVRMIKNISNELKVVINIVEAEDGIEAMYHFYKMRNNGINVSAILSDETMKFMKGSECSKTFSELYSLQSTNKIPFFILTAYEDLNTINCIKNYYVTDVFTKPFSKYSAISFINSFTLN